MQQSERFQHRLEAVCKVSWMTDGSDRENWAEDGTDTRRPASQMGVRTSMVSSAPPEAPPKAFVDNPHLKHNDNASKGDDHHPFRVPALCLHSLGLL
jgi:hypothetical protein